MEIMMDNSDINVGKNAQGMRAIVAIDRKSGLRVVIPFDDAGARAVAKGLTEGLVVVQKVLDRN
jgi:hypothetical protein